MEEQDLTVADAIARMLHEKIDVNELSKCVGFLRDNPDGSLFFDYLDTVIAEGRAVVRSGRTLDYYRAIRKTCRQHLKPYQDDPQVMAQILGWATRLMHYYAVEDKLGRARPPKPARRPQKSRPTTADGRRTGTVKWFNKQKGYGFISPDGGGEDLFVHKSQTPDQQGVREGQRVSFIAGKGPKGRSQAQVVQPE